MYFNRPGDYIVPGSECQTCLVLIILIGEPNPEPSNHSFIHPLVPYAQIKAHMFSHYVQVMKHVFIHISSIDLVICLILWQTGVSYRQKFMSISHTMNSIAIICHLGRRWEPGGCTSHEGLNWTAEKQTNDHSHILIVPLLTGLRKQVTCQS